MMLGHINLARSFNGTGEHIIGLVEALDRQGVTQHVIVRNEALAKRLRLYKGVSVGPTTGAAVMAYCLMPTVDVVHAHDSRGAQAGLLLTLTRSIPFVLTHRADMRPYDNPLGRSTFDRAAGIVCATDAGSRSLNAVDATRPVDVINDITRAGTDDFEMIANRAAAKHMRVYRRAAEASSVPAFLL
ncbi:MAG: glycosyltransferase [Woeseiaceae bacterium]